MTFCENLPPMVPATSKVAVIGNAAHDDPNVGPPVKIGGGSRTLGQVPDAVQDQDVADALLDEYGRQRFILDAMPGPTVTSTFTAAASGTTQFTGFPVSKFALQIKNTGAVTAWNIVVEGSLDGTNFTTLATHVNGTNADGATVWVVDRPVLYWRLRCTSITLGGGTNSIARAIAMQ